MNRFWDFKLTGAPPLLSLSVRRRRASGVLADNGGIEFLTFDVLRPLSDLVEIAQRRPG